MFGVIYLAGCVGIFEVQGEGMLCGAGCSKSLCKEWTIGNALP